MKVLEKKKQSINDYMPESIEKEDWRILNQLILLKFQTYSTSGEIAHMLSYTYTVQSSMYVLETNQAELYKIIKPQEWQESMDWLIRYSRQYQGNWTMDLSNKSMTIWTEYPSETFE